MSRRKKAEKREHKADPKYGQVKISHFINYVMRKGKKSVAQKIVYGALDLVEKKTKKKAIEVFDKALRNVTPLVETRSRRVGGATYQVPFKVEDRRGFSLACRWIIKAVRNKKGKPTEEKLAEEIIAASKNEGEAVRKREMVHKMAEANKAFAHFAWGKKRSK